MLLVIVVEKLASSPRAAANSFKVSIAPGAPSTRLATASGTTKAVVASCVVFVPAEAVGAAGVPVKVGEAISALRAIAASASAFVLIYVSLYS